MSDTDNVLLCATCRASQTVSGHDSPDTVKGLCAKAANDIKPRFE